jgi:hypothetical protein
LVPTKNLSSGTRELSNSEERNEPTNCSSKREQQRRGYWMVLIESLFISTTVNREPDQEPKQTNSKDPISVPT